MLDFDRLTPDFLSPLATIVGAVRDCAPGLSSADILLVGAWCRDVLHTSLGHDFPTSATRDVDLALALADWESFEVLAAAFPRVGNTGLRYEIAGQRVDLLPFGRLEDPPGLIVPPTRDEAISVWAFDEIHRAALSLPVSATDAIRVPTVAGYTASKLAAWLDRSAWREVKDANDLALAAFWYSESTSVQDRLFDSANGQALLIHEDLDATLAAVRLLGQDVVDEIGALRRAELVQRWPGDSELLTRSFETSGGSALAPDVARRREVIGALSRGLTESTSS